MQHTKDLRVIVMLALVVTLALVTGAQAQQSAVDETLGRPAPVGGPVSGGPVPPGGTEALLDDFNRADGPIGDAWTVRDGYCNVVSNAAVCGGMGRATFNSGLGAGDEAEVDIAANGTSLQYAGLLLNYGAGSTNLFLKVQEQSPYAGQFTNGGCYTGNNGTSFGLGFFGLTSPFTTAHMVATRVGDDVTIVFSNIDGGAQPDQTYVCSGAPAREGIGIGILGYAGIAQMDNFGSAAIPVELMSLSVE